MEDRLPIVSLMEIRRRDERKEGKKRRMEKDRRKMRGKREKVQRKGRVFLNRAALAFCWLNGKTEERKREKNERRGK